MKINRFRGYRFRRYALAMNIVGGIWLLISAIMFILNGSRLRQRFACHYFLFQHF
jgi:hypothetical protein